MKIAFIDSGIGGLSVLKHIHSYESPPSLSTEVVDIIYLADLANLPYGEKSHQQLITILCHNLDILSKLNIDIVILACNTSSALINAHIRAQYPHMQIYGLLDSLYLIPQFSHIVIHATPATCTTGKYQQILSEILPSAEIEAIACPLLVPFIESNLSDLNTIAAQNILANYTSSIQEAYIWGCTHYPFLEQAYSLLCPHAIAVDPGKLLMKHIFQDLPPFMINSYHAYTTEYQSLSLINKLSQLHDISYFTDQISSIYSIFPPSSSRSI